MQRLRQQARKGRRSTQGHAFRPYLATLIRNGRRTCWESAPWVPMQWEKGLVRTRHLLGPSCLAMLDSAAGAGVKEEEKGQISHPLDAGHWTCQATMHDGQSDGSQTVDAIEHECANHVNLRTKHANGVHVWACEQGDKFGFRGQVLAISGLQNVLGPIREPALPLPIYRCNHFHCRRCCAWCLSVQAVPSVDRRWRHELPLAGVRAIRIPTHMHAHMHAYMYACTHVYACLYTRTSLSPSHSTSGPRRSAMRNTGPCTSAHSHRMWACRNMA